MKTHRLLHVTWKSVAFVLLFAFQLLARTSFTGKVPVLQSFTNENMTLITVLREPGQNFTYEISPKSAATKIEVNDVGQKHKTDTLEVTGLEIGVDYKILIKDSTGKVVDSRNFKALDPNQADPKAALCSCSRVGMLSPDDKKMPMWDQVAAQKPNAIVFLGDLVYGDNATQAVLKHFLNYHPKIEQIEKRFIQSWKKERLYRQENLTPLFSIWDDHDFGYENADHSNPYKERMRKLFRAYYPIPKDNSIVSHGPGVSFSFTLFGKKFLMLDNRTYHDPKKKSLLGMQQVEWIENEIKDQKEVVIASGMSILKMGEKSKQENLADDAPTEWEAFRGIFAKHPVRAVFLTGDVHFSEVRFIPKEVLGFETVQGVFSHLKSTSSFFTPPFSSGYQKDDTNQRHHGSGRGFAILSMQDIYTKFQATFHASRSIDHVIRRIKTPGPIDFILEFNMNQCERFYNARAN